MGIVPDDIKSGLTNLAKSSKVEVKVLVEELKEIIASDETIKSMPVEQEEFKIRYAWAVLCRRHTAVGQVEQLYVRPLSKPRFNTVKSGKGRLDLFALVRRITKDENDNDVIGEVELGAGTLWEKAAEAARKISSKKVYKVSLKATSQKAQVGDSLIEGVELNANDATFIETTETSFPSNEEFYKSFIEPKEKDLKIDLDEMDLHNHTNRLDLRILKGMIIEHRVGVTSTGSEFGQYIVTDDSMLGGGDDGKAGSYTFWIAPEEVVYEKGVTMKFIGTVNYDKANNKIRWNYFFGVPVGVAVKRKVEQKPVEKPTEDVDIDTDEEPKEIPSSSDDDFAV